MASSSATDNKRNCFSAAVTTAISTLLLLIFSSMTCLSVDSASNCASAIVMLLLYWSCRLVWAPSLPLPMALASYRENVPDGSVW